MSTKSKSKSKQQEALQILDDLDSLSPDARQPGADTSAAAVNPGEAADVLAFLDAITQKSSEPTRPAASLIDRPLSRSGTPTLRKSTERVKLGGSLLTNPGSSSGRGVSPSTSSSNLVPTDKQETAPEHELQADGGGWGWGSVWSSASSALQQARTVVDEQVKNLPAQDTKKWKEGVIGYAKNAQERAQEYANNTQLEKLGKDLKRVGLSTFNDILNAVAPPISEHEVIQVWLSHDMQGLEGAESLVYSALTRILEQVEGGDLVVNKGNESKPKEASNNREINAVEGFEQALKLAQANLEEIIKTNAPPDPQLPSSVQNPTTTSYVYLRIQPFISAITTPEPDSTESTRLQFILCLADPAHKLSCMTVTQAIPDHWLNVWDQYDWVEDKVAEVLQLGVEVIGQEYIVGRMGWVRETAALNMPKEGTKSKAVEKTEKTPRGGAPKRALSPYMFFALDWRDRIRAENPDANFGEIGKLLGIKWKELEDEEKKTYIEQAARDKIRAEREKSEYNNAGSGDGDDDEE